MSGGGTRDRKLTPKGHDYQIDILSKDIKSTRQRLRNQTSLFEDLLKTENAGRVDAELKVLERIFAKLELLVQRVNELMQEDGRKRMTEMLEEEKESVVKVKKAVNGWIDATRTEDDVKSNISLTSKKSSRSKEAGAEEDLKSNRSSKKSSKSRAANGQAERGEGEMEAGFSECFASKKTSRPKPSSVRNKELVSEGTKLGSTRMTIDLIRGQSRLEGQLSLLNDLLQCNDVGMMERELVKLEDVYKEMAELNRVLSEKLGTDEKVKVKDIVETGELQVLSMRELVKERVDQLNDGKTTDRSRKRKDEDVQSHVSFRSRLSCPVRAVAKKGSRRRSTSVDAASEKGIERSEKRMETEERKGNLIEAKTGVIGTKRKGEANTIARRKRSTSLDDSVGKVWNENDDRGVEETEARDGNRNDKKAKHTSKEEDSHSVLSGRSRLSCPAAKTDSRMRRRRSVSLDAVTSKVSKGSRERRESEAVDGMYSQYLAKKFEDLVKRVEDQNDLVNELLRTHDQRMMSKEMQILDVAYDHLDELARNLKGSLDADKIDALFDLLHKSEAKVSRTKGLVAQWMVKQVEGERRSLASSVSRQSDQIEGDRRSLASRVSRRSDASKVSKGSCRSKSQCQGAKSMETKDNLTSLMERNRERVRSQRHLVADLLESNDSEMMNREVNIMEQLLEGFMDGVEKLLQMPGESGKEWERRGREEDAKVFQLKRQVVKWMVAQADADLKSNTSGSSRTTCISDVMEGIKPFSVQQGSSEQMRYGERNGGVPLVGHSEDQLRNDLRRVRVKLDNQRILVEDFVKSADRDIINREMQTLDNIYDDMIAVASALRDTLLPEEGQKVSLLIDAEDEKVFQTKRLVAQGRLQEGADMVKGPVQGEDRHRKVVSKQQQAGMEEGASANLVKLNELMVQTLRMQAAPKVDIDTFHGDPLEYEYFVETIRDGVEKLIDDPRQRLVRLLKFTEGDAKDLIKHCIHEDHDTCYAVARSLLEKEYGNPLKIACAYLEKLKGWPTIKANDAVGIQKLSRFLLRCASYQKRGVLDLDSPLTIRGVQLALPVNLQQKWVARVGRIRRKTNKEAKFVDFVEFVDEESVALNDPVYSRAVNPGPKVNPDPKNLKVNKTDVTEGNGKGEVTKICPLCKAEHDLDGCEDFKKKGKSAKKDFLFRTMFRVLWQWAPGAKL